MRSIPLDEAVGERLGYTIYDSRARILLRSGVHLTPIDINKLKERGYHSIPVYDPLVPEAIPIEAITEETRQQALATTERVFETAGGSAIGTAVAVRRVVDQILRDLAHSPSLSLSLSAIRSIKGGLFSHSVNVCVYSAILGTAMGYDTDACRTLGMGALLHDIGKIYYMDLVNKEGPLTQDEFRLIMRHTLEGYEMLKGLPDLSPLAAQIALQHHERIDASGYPRHLKADQIHPWSKIVGVADVYDTVTADRPYGHAIAPHEAMAEIESMAASGKLDSLAVRTLLRRIAVFPEGTILLLDTGEISVVVAQTEKGSRNPQVRVVSDPQLNLVVPTERVIDGNGEETSVRSVLLAYPPRLLDQTIAALPRVARISAREGWPPSDWH